LALGVAAADFFTPVMVTSLFRHGARSPSINDLKLEWVKQVGEGNLTNVGMRQHYLLGKLIKKNYPDLFDYSKFTNYDYFLRSSPTWRTMQSAQSHLHGIYQGGETIDEGFGAEITNELTENINPKFSPLDVNITQKKALPYGFGAFPIVTGNPKFDFLFKLKDSCPNLVTLMKPSRKEKEQIYDNVPKDTYEALDKLGFKPSQFGAKGTDGWNLNRVYRLTDSIIADYYYTGKLYPGIDEQLFKKLEIVSSMSFLLEYSTDEIVRMWTDGLSKAVLEGIDGKIKGTIPHKFRMYSGHDSNVIPFMMKYGLTTSECLKELYQTGKSTGVCELQPNFASSFIWELAQRDSDQSYFVRVLYNGKPIKICPDNEEEFYCKYSDFKTYHQDNLFSKDFNKSCKSPYVVKSHSKTALVFTLLTLLLALLVASFLLFKFFKAYKKTLAFAEFKRGKESMITS
jgi:hypothetical protein